ncbi:MAG: toll/interleukin-1 receptor domain-containing protein [Pseudomonadota bacterium]
MDGYDVFISYARIDAEKAALVRERLTALGLTVFFDVEGIDTGEEFPDIIDREVKNAKCVLGLWSRAAFRGRWVRIESRIGLDQKKLVAAVLDGMRPEELPAEFYNVNVEDLADYRGQEDHSGWKRLVRAVGKRVGRADLAAGPVGESSLSKSAANLHFRPSNPWVTVGLVVVAIATLFLLHPFRHKPDAPAQASATANAAHVADLTGAWRGAYEQAGKQTPFEAELRSEIEPAGGSPGGVRAFTGQIGEPNSFGAASANYLYADVRGELHADGVLTFTKTYNGAGGVGHTVEYRGRLDAGGTAIDGVWDIDNMDGGPFSMDRR